MNPADTNHKPLAVPAHHPAMADSQMARSGFLSPLAFGPTADSGPQLPPGVAAAPTMSTLGHALRRRWPLAVLIGATGAIIAVAGILYIMPPQYTATARVLISARPEGKVIGEWGYVEEPDFALFKLNVAGTLKNPLVLLNALNRKTRNGQDVKDLSIVKGQGGSVDWIEKAIKTVFKDSPETMTVTLGAERPEEGAELLNAVLDAFLEEYGQREKQKRKQRVEQVKENQKELERELDKYRLELRVAEQKDNVTTDKDTARQKYIMALASLSKAQEELTKNKIGQITSKQEAELLREKLKKPEDLTVPQEKFDELFRLDPRTLGVTTELQFVEKEFSLLGSAVRPELLATLRVPLDQKKASVLERMAKLKEDMRPELEDRLRLAVITEIRGKIGKLEDAAQLLELQEPVLHANLKSLDKEAQTLAPMNQQMQPAVVRLKEKITNTEMALGKVAVAIHVLAAEPLAQRVSILQYASEPRGKDYSRQTKFGAVGALGLFCLGLFGVAFFEFRSRKINGAQDIAHGLGLNVVGSLPAMPTPRKPSGDGGSPQLAAWQNQLHEAVDGVRTMLMHASRSENLRVNMVTSAVGGEGKTSLASQLASSLARAWRKTLLIDGDLRHPAGHKLFDLPLEPGFSEVLRNEANVTDAIKPTQLSRLWLMPAGHVDAHAVQALAQDNMRTLFEQLKQQYDFIIVDSSPVLPVADALLLGQHVDGVLFSVLRDVSRSPNVYAAQQKLSNLAVRVLGAVMVGVKDDVGKLGSEYAQVG